VKNRPVETLDAEDVAFIHGDCVDVLPTLKSASFDLCLTDPPYPEISRDYGRMTECNWHALMRFVVKEVRRLLKPTGSAVFILQPNSRHVGSMRSWLWDFLSWVSKEWNVVQDIYWWNPATPPSVHCNRSNHLLRPSLKYCIWLGPPTCYRNQDNVLWTQSDANKACDRQDRLLRYKPYGGSMRNGRAASVADERDGGVTPFNLLPILHNGTTFEQDGYDHGARTPIKVCEWFIKYLCPSAGNVLDPFSGSGTVPATALRLGHFATGIEKQAKYHAVAQRRLANLCKNGEAEDA